MSVGDIVTYPGTYVEWEVIETGTTPGRTLSSGYHEPDWHWVRVQRHDGSWPGFSHRITDPRKEYQ